MKTRTLFYGLSAIALVAFIALFCASPQDPRTEPGNAKITAFKTNFRGGDTVFVPFLIYIPYRCTVNLQLPELIDSLIVKKSRTGTVVLTTPITPQDSQFVFLFGSNAFGKDTLIAYIVRKQNAGNDTMLKPYFSPSLYMRLYSLCALNTTCITGYDTLFADTCAYDRDSVADPADSARYLRWIGDSIVGKQGIFRLRKITTTICLPTCFSVWLSRRWVIERTGLIYPCPWTWAGSDTIYWRVVNSDLDTVTQPLILKRSATCP